MITAEIECLLNLIDYRRGFIILIDKIGGTKYEREKEHFIKRIEAHLLKHHEDGPTDAVFVHIVANHLVDGLAQIMCRCKGKE